MLIHIHAWVFLAALVIGALSIDPLRRRESLWSRGVQLSHCVALATFGCLIVVIVCALAVTFHKAVIW